MLAALEQVSDQLKALDADAETAAASRAALDAASLNVTLGDANLSAGVIGDYDALTLQIAGRSRAARSDRGQGAAAAGRGRPFTWPVAAAGTAGPAALAQTRTAP